MFLDESRLAAQLSHPNVVQVFDFGESDDSYFLAMEYLSGEDCSTILRSLREQRRVMPAQITAVIGSLACEGLHYAHTLPGETGEPLGIVHRDISPSNLMVTYQGAVKVLDFGIAKAQGKIVKTEAGMVKGKFMYMSPEQARGREVDKRSDVFALGAVLYEMVTGVRVFQRDNQLAMLLAVTEEPIKPPQELQPDVPDELQAIIMRALERDVDRRFPSAQAMREAIDDFLADRTYAPSHVQLRQFLVHLFGDEHVREKSRPPVLSGKGPAKPKTPSHPSAAKPPSAPSAPAAPAPPGVQDQATRIGGSVPAAPAAPAPPDSIADETTRIGQGLSSASGPPVVGASDGATRIKNVSEIKPVPGVDFDDDFSAPPKSKLPLIIGGVLAVGVAFGIYAFVGSLGEEKDLSPMTPMFTKAGDKTGDTKTADPVADPVVKDPVVKDPDPVVVADPCPGPRPSREGPDSGPGPGGGGGPGA